MPLASTRTCMFVHHKWRKSKVGAQSGVFVGDVNILKGMIEFEAADVPNLTAEIVPQEVADLGAK
jgi:hypothetical protein